jgi:peptide deformylase
MARCLQHEVDHLDGKLFVDRLTGDARKQVLRALRS